MKINRPIQPAGLIPGKPRFNPPSKQKLDNGIPLYLMNSGHEHVTKLELIFEAGVWQEDAPLQAALSNSMLQEGSKNYTANRIAEVFDFHGAYLQLFADYHYGVVSIISLNKHLPKILPIVEEIVKHSIFPDQEFDTLVQRRKQRFLLENEKVKVRSQKKFSEVLFGGEHPYSQTVDATDFDALKKEMLVDFYTRNYRSDHCRIVASGALDSNLSELINQHFGQSDWNGSSYSASKKAIAPVQTKTHFVEKSDAIQSAIRVGKLMVNKDHPDFAGILFLNAILGGYFSSRLMANIREEKGYTYGIGSSVPAFLNAAYLVISTEVDKKYEQATINEIFKELKTLRTTAVGTDELERVRQYLLGEFIRDFDGPFARLSAFRNVNDFGLDYSFYENYYQTLLSISAESVQQLAQMYFAEEDFYTVVAGRK